MEVRWRSAQKERKKEAQSKLDRDGTFESFVILAAHLFSCFPNLCNYGSTLSSAQQLRGSPFVRRRFLDDLAVKTCVFFFFVIVALTSQGMEWEARLVFICNRQLSSFIFFFSINCVSPRALEVRLFCWIPAILCLHLCVHLDRRSPPLGHFPSSRCERVSAALRWDQT